MDGVGSRTREYDLLLLDQLCDVWRPEWWSVATVACLQCVSARARNDSRRHGHGRAFATHFAKGCVFRCLLRAASVALSAPRQVPHVTSSRSSAIGRGASV